MDDRTFAGHLAAWVNPAAVLAAAAGHARDPQPVQTTAQLSWSSAVPGMAHAIGLDTLVGKLLRGFQLPTEFVELLALRYPQIPKGSWDFVLALRFEGDVSYRHVDERGDGETLLVEDRASVAGILAGPLNFLCHHTSLTASLWSSDARQRRDFLEHSSYSDWLVFLEYTVAAALGREAFARSAEPGDNAQVIYGDGTVGISMLGQPPFQNADKHREAFEMLCRGAAERWQALHRDSSAIASEAMPFDFTAAVPTGRPAPAKADGFVDIDQGEAVEPWRNISRWRNECSPYAILHSRDRTRHPSIDSYYGRVFDFPLEENLGIYGITRAMPEMPASRRPDSYLRSPYRKVPCYDVKDLADLQSALNCRGIFGDGSGVLFRGQAGGYNLPRSASAREVLYGDADTVEPSLLATSTRFAKPLEAVMPAWVLLVRMYLEWIWTAQRDMPEVADRVAPIIEEDATRLSNELDLHLYAISLAQHYGLPTMGLDVTDDLKVALFFALHQSKRTGRNVAFHRKSAADRQSVLYVFAPDQRYRLDYERARPRTVGEGRPERQSAKFLITGWGYHQNAAARHLAMALNLDPAGDYGPLPTVRQLFPERAEDLFGDFLERALEQGLPTELRQYVEQLYWVVE